MDKKLVFYTQNRNGESRALYYGRYSKIKAFKNLRVSIVNYTVLNSEKWQNNNTDCLDSIISGEDSEFDNFVNLEVTQNKIIFYNKKEEEQSNIIKVPQAHLHIAFENGPFHNDKTSSKFTFEPGFINDLYQVYQEFIMCDVNLKNIKLQFKGPFWNYRNNKDLNWLIEVTNVLNRRWDEFVSLEELSEIVKLHPVTISKAFKIKYNIKIREYMRRLKVKKALYFILNSNQSFGQIAHQSGFSDQSHMNRLIRTHTGLTPAQIRLIAYN